MGKRRNIHRPELIVKEQQVVALRAQGLTWEQIANQVGYSSSSSAHSAWERAAKRAVLENVEQIRNIEGQRLDIAQNAIWEQVITGDIPAVNTLLKIMERRARLLGLDTPVTQNIRAEVITYDANDIRTELARIVASANTQPTNSGTTLPVGELESQTEPVTT